MNLLGIIKVEVGTRESKRPTSLTTSILFEGHSREELTFPPFALTIFAKTGTRVKTKNAPVQDCVLHRKKVGAVLLDQALKISRESSEHSIRERFTFLTRFLPCPTLSKYISDKRMQNRFFLARVSLIKRDVDVGDRVPPGCG
jgi:hypothetical protein